MDFTLLILFLVLAVMGALIAWAIVPHLVRGGSKGAWAFGTDMTQLAKQSKLDPISGREAEIERVIHILLRRTKNNPLLLGQPGVGKSAVIERLAIRIAEGEVPELLKDARILSLDLANFVTQTKYRGQMEARLRQVLNSLESTSGNTILFIDEIHMLEQLSGIEGSLALTDLLKPALARGDVQIIGATTWSEYEETIHKDAALDRRFQPVLIDEPTREVAIKMMQHIRPVYEAFHGVSISDEALEAAVRLSDEKIEHRYLPDKAIDVIDEAAAKAAIEACSGQMVPAGAIHEAGAKCESRVEVQDIESVIDQWVIHSSEDQRRDARQDDV